MIERKIEISDEEDQEEVLDALSLLQEGAEIVIKQSEKRGARPLDSNGELVIPLHLDDDIRVLVIKSYIRETQH